MKAVVFSLMFLASSTCFAQSTVKTNYENGSVKSEYVQEGDLVAVTHFYKSGQVKETGFFKNETPDGKWEAFAVNGSKTAEINYLNGKRHGEFRVWDEFAGAYIEMKYANGEVINANRYVKQSDFAVRNK